MVKASEENLRRLATVQLEMTRCRERLAKSTTDAVGL